MINFNKEEDVRLSFKESKRLQKEYKKSVKETHGRGYRKIVKINKLFVELLESFSFTVFEDHIHIYLTLDENKVVNGSLGFLVYNEWQLQTAKDSYEQSKLKKFLDSKHCNLDFDIFIK